MSFAEFIFWGSFALVAYAYVLYPGVIWMLSHSFGTLSAWQHADQFTVDRPDEDWPFVSLLIAAYKESVILERLQNALELDYPADRFEVLVGCDGNEDLTGDLVVSFNDPRVRLVQFPQRRGKASVLNDCVPQAEGEIIVFSDANTMMHRDALKNLVRHFRDKYVGGVCGKLILTDPTTGENVDGMYWRFENFLKKNEARFGALLGFNGAIYAIRKELYEPLPSNTIVDDFVIGMRIHTHGYQVLYDEDAVAYEETPPTIDSEFQRRMRIGAGAFQSLVWLRSLLSPRHGRVAFSFWSHKVLRWYTPIFMIAALISNAVLSSDPFYLRVLLLHELFYLMALVGLWCMSGRRWQRIFKVPAMFVSMNAALLMGLFRWLRGINGGTWKRTERAEETPVAVASVKNRK